jgi:hypothetical protein
MNAQQLHQDIATGCLVEVEQSACSYYDNVRGLTARQQFFIYPNDAIASLTTIDGTGSVIVLSGDDEATFRSIHRGYFA